MISKQYSFLGFMRHIFIWVRSTVESRSIVFQGDGENKWWMRTNDQSRKLLHNV